MKHKALSIGIAGILLTVLASVSAEAAAPFGSFGGRVGGGNAGSGVMQLHGWALDDGGIDSIDILVDNVVVGRAFYQRSRPAVTSLYPSYPDSALPGFAYELDTTHFLNGTHRVTARARSRTGETVVLPPARNFQFNNITHNLAPFGKIEYPNQGAELFGNCDPTSPLRRYAVVSGYALDSGVQPDDRGVGYVELLLDRAIFASSKTSCFFSNVTGGYSNCYGLRRLDVEPFFPGLPDAPTAGFRFVVDIGALLSPGDGGEPFYNPGRHTFTVRAGDLFGQTKNIGEIQVTFSCYDFLNNEGAFGSIDVPVNGRLYAGQMIATGWALDWEGVDNLSVLVDGIEMGKTILNRVRPEVASAYPGYPQSVNPGWIFYLDTTLLSNGTHELEVLTHDTRGNDTFIGKRPFVVANPGRE
jgi:hypothetical protein